MGTVKKHCSILNHVRHKDSELFDLVQDLCIGYKFRPRGKDGGLTFLRPNKDLKMEIEKLAAGDKPEEAIAIFDNLLLPECYEKLSELKGDVATLSGNVLPEKVLKGISDDSFKSRDDRNRIAVYQVKATAADFKGLKTAEKAPKAPKTGGGQTRFDDEKGQAVISRELLFNHVLKLHAKPERAGFNPSMEILISLVQFADQHPELRGKSPITSQLSYDTLASLAIVLQPCCRADFTYVTKDFFDAWAAVNDIRSDGAIDLYCSLDENPVEAYKGLMERAVAEAAAAGKVDDKTSLRGAVEVLQNTLMESASKVTITGQLMDAYQAASNLTKKNKLQLFAEAELRVFSAILFNNCAGVCPAYEDMHTLYFVQCKLDRPYICHDRNLVAASTVAFYYSVVYLLARSDALVYIPGIGKTYDSMDNVQKDTGRIELAKDFLQVTENKKYTDFDDKIKRLLSRKPANAQ